MRALPSWILRTVGLVVPLARALAEMTYQWEVPYLADDSDFCRTFGVSATPLEQAIAEVMKGAFARTGHAYELQSIVHLGALF